MSFNFFNLLLVIFLVFSNKKSIILTASLSPSYSSALFLSSPKNRTVGNPSILYLSANSLSFSQLTAPNLNKPFVDFANFSNSG